MVVGDKSIALIDPGRDI